MVKKVFLMGLISVMCLGIFTACHDYGYEFDFSVVGENGSILAEEWNSSPITMMGGKDSSYEVKFKAIPEEGYQVKEWTFNGKTVENNKTNSFTASATHLNFKQLTVTITVEFELIT